VSEAASGDRLGSPTPGIDSVDELWSRLRETTHAAKTLAAANRQLAARVTSLERQLGDTGALRDDELVAELPLRMGRALQSAQEVAEELVSRAKKREQMIRDKTDQRSAALITQAQAEATAILRRAAGEAVGRINDAKAHAESIVGSAHAHHDEVMARLRDHAAVLEDRVRQLHLENRRLAKAYEVIEQTFSQAKAALRESIEMAGPRPAPVGDHGDSTDTGAATPLYAVRDQDVALYDWSPPASGTA
jgi:cell division septum initiation protein DivIVA